jgi:hypothetical protein
MRRASLLLIGLLLLPAPASADWWLSAARVAAASAQVADTTTTLQALQSGRGTEANPIMRALTDRPYVFIATKLGTAYLIDRAQVELARSGKRTWAAVLGYSVAGGVGAIAWRNAQQGR